MSPVAPQVHVWAEDPYCEWPTCVRVDQGGVPDGTWLTGVFQVLDPIDRVRVLRA